MFACSCESITNVTRCSSMNELVDDPEYLGAGRGEGGVCFCGCLRFWKEKYVLKVFTDPHNDFKPYFQLFKSESSSDNVFTTTWLWCLYFFADKSALPADLTSCNS